MDRDEIGDEDNRGTAECGGRPSQSGCFEKEDAADGILEQEFKNQTEYITFKVTMQPGDNFRIVGSGDEDFLKNLKNDDAKLNVGPSARVNANKQRIVDNSVFRVYPSDPRLAEIREPDKYASKTLSVWRFFHAEIDYMGEIREDTLQGEIASIQPNTPSSNLSQINLSLNIADELWAQGITKVSAFRGSRGVKDSFRDGTITFRGTSYTGLNNSDNEGGNDHVIVRGVLDPSLARSQFFLKNDDEEMGFRKGVDLKTALDPQRETTHIGTDSGRCSIRSRYQWAYIEPNFTLLNSRTRNPPPRNVVPFKRNLAGYDTDNSVLNTTYRFDNIREQDNPNFWTVYILFAFKGGTYEDADPDNFIGRTPTGAAALGDDSLRESVLSGIADKRKEGVTIFLECIVEKNSGNYFPNTRTGTGENDTVSHELAHLFGAEHGDKGLMAFPDPMSKYFSRRSLGRIRSAVHP